MIRSLILALVLAVAASTVPACGGAAQVGTSHHALTGNDWAWANGQALNTHLGIAEWPAGTYAYKTQVTPPKWKSWDSVSGILRNWTPTQYAMDSMDWELR